jgi:hypothetical protein
VLKSGLACGMGWDQIPIWLCHPTARNGCLIEKDFWRTRRIETDLPMFPTSPRRYAHAVGLSGSDAVEIGSGAVKDI